MNNNNSQSANRNQIPASPDQPTNSDTSQPAMTTSINPDSLPPGTTVPVATSTNPEQTQVPPPNKFSIFKLKFLIIFILIIFAVAGATGGYLFYLKQKTTYYTLLPDDSQFYLGLSVKNHPQVQKMLGSPPETISSVAQVLPSVFKKSGL